MNLTLGLKLFLSFWPIYIGIFIIGLLKVIFDLNFRKTHSSKPNLSLYERKPFIFDSRSEFEFYKTLLEIFADKYHIFTQVNYSHLIKPKKNTWWEERRLRSSIDRKSADFVLCDKEYVIPKVIIELDGPFHNSLNKQKRDIFIDELTKIVELPILHFKINETNKEFVKDEINKKLVR